MAVEDLLEGHLAMQLRIQCHEDGAQAAPGMGPEDAEPLPVGGRRADGEAGGAVGVIFIEVSRRMRHAEVAERRTEVRVAQVGQAVADRPAGGDGGEALSHIAAVGLDVHGRQGLDGGPLGGIEVPLRDEMVGEGARLVAGPGVERGDELRRLDQPGLQGEQAE